MKPSKPPTKVRPGQRKPFRKANAQEVDERIQEVITMLGSGYSRTDIIRAFRTLNEKQKASIPKEAQGHYRYDLDWRTIDAYINRAKTEMLARQGRTKQDVRGEAIAFYESVLKGDADKRTKIEARKRLDEIHGIDAPKQTRTQLTGDGGGPVKVEDAAPVVLPQRRLRELLVMLGDKDALPHVSRSKNGNANGNGSHSGAE